MGAAIVTLPNALSAFRVAAVPVLMGLAWSGRAGAFLALLGAAFLSDSVDGWLARRLRQESVTGARLDTWGDVATYTSLPICAWWLWPDIMRREAAFVVPVLTSFFAPIVYACVKYGRITSYHTWTAKLASIAMSVSVVLLFAHVTPWPFRLCAVVPVLAALEEMAITTILPEWRADIPSFWHARRLRRVPRGTHKEQSDERETG